MPRFRIRTLMIAVAIVALAIAAIGPGVAGYRRWAYHRADAVRYAKLEAQELLNQAKERAASNDREAIRADLEKAGEFRGKSREEQEAIIERVAEFHRRQADQSLAAVRNGQSADGTVRQRRSGRSTRSRQMCLGVRHPPSPPSSVRLRRVGSEGEAGVLRTAREYFARMRLS